MYQRFPRVDAYDCWAVSLGGGKGPTMQGAAPSPPLTSVSSSSSLSSSLLPKDFVVRGGEEEDENDNSPKLNVILPDLSDGTWRFNRTASSLAFLEERRRNKGKKVEEKEGSSPPSGSSSSDRKRKRPRGGGGSTVKPIAFSKTLRTAASSGAAAAGSSSSDYGSYLSRWTFWLDAANGNAPLRLEALSKNLWTGGHYDLTVAEFSDWRPGAVPDGAFAVPPGCPLRPSPDSGSNARLSLSFRGSVSAPPLPADFLSLALPNRHWGHARYDEHLHSGLASSSGGPARVRRTKSRKEYRERAAAFEASLRMVERHNNNNGEGSSSSASNPSYKLAINHLADLLPHEKAHGGGLIARHPRPEGFSRAAAAAAAKRKSAAAGGAPATFFSSLDAFHEPSVSFASLPATVDWRGSPADSPVKDQAMCGSCFAFGSVGSLEAAVFRETGKQILLSEQQVVDCSWSDSSYKGKYPNAGCYGGYQTTVFDWYFRR